MKKITKILSLAAANLLAACSNQAAPAKETMTVAPEITVQQTTQVPATTSSVATNSSKSIGSQNAMQKELIEVFQKAYPDLDITKIELVYGKYYEVEAMNSTTEFTYRYDQNSKTFILAEQDNADPNEHNLEKLDLPNLKQVYDMIAIAQKAFPTGVLREWSVDKDHGDIIWEFEFHESNGNDVTVKVSNSTGQVLEIDR
jgi:hypothetical protein